MRCATARRAEHWFPRYYGTRRRDAALPRPALRGLALDGRRDARPALREPALRALEWIDEYGDLDGDGFVEYRRRSERGLVEPVVEGLRRLAALPRRPLRRGADRAVRGAGLRLRREAAARPSSPARSGATRSSPTGSSGRRTSCRRASTRRSGCEDRGGYYALALDGKKRRVDSLCSNIGHLLWSGIVPAERVDAIVDQLMGDELWSGWGIRTMSARDAALQPAQLPQRHRLAARQFPGRMGPRALRRAGPRRTGSPARMLEAAAHFDYRCPRSSRASRGRRRRSRSPIRRPRGRRRGPPARRCSCSSSCSASSPTAAPGGSSPTRPQSCRPGSAAPALAACAHSTVVGRPARERARHGGRGRVKIAVLSPVWFPVPPTRYGGIEWIVSLLADGLVDAGHDVTLFASGDSQHAGRARRRSSTRRRASRSGTRWELRHALSCLERAADFDVINDHTGPLGAVLGGVVDTPVVHTVHGPLDGEPRRALRRRSRKVCPERRADLALA